MEGQSPAISPSSASPAVHFASTRYSKLEINLTVIKTNFGSASNDVGSSSDSADAAIDDLSKSLSIKADKIISKLNEILKGQLPDGGIAALKPEDVTPEATADRIVKSVTALFDTYSKQRPNDDPEQVLSKFMEDVRQGVQSGYDDAYKILDNLGAFDIEGVKDGVEQTKKLIEDKLKAFEAQKRQDLGLAPSVDTTQLQQDTSTALLQQAGAAVKGVNVVA